MPDDIYFGKGVYVPQGQCPVCQALLDGVTKISTKRVEDDNPCEGDFSVCIYCGSMLRFGIGLTLYEVTRQDLKQLLDEDPEVFKLLQRANAAAKQAITDRRRQRHRSN
jgi:hypothetical protein